MTRNLQNTPKSYHVALVAYEGSQMSAVMGLGDIFDVANRMVEVLDGSTITYEVLLEVPIHENRFFDAFVLPPNLKNAKGEPDKVIHKWLAEQHKLGSIACSACAGAYWLGRAGILNGRSATTHWALEEDFKQTFPTVNLLPEHILLDDNDVVTAGGVMAWVDLGLHLVRRWLGSSVVSKTCRQMLIDPAGREQRNYRSFRPNLAHPNQAIRELQLWMESNVKNDLSVNVLAKCSNISLRSLQRHFTNCTGMSLNQYVQELRVEKARRLLELTSRSFSDICWEVGYRDVSAFSRLFKSTCGLSARDYRRRFRVG